MARPSTGKTIFLSYAHKDGAALAQRLQDNLTQCGHSAWLDTQRLQGGASWTREIETVLDQAEVVLALLTPGSYGSEICRAEQLRALRKGKNVIPILGQPGAEIPLHLETKQYRDFTSTSGYAQRLQELLQDIEVGKGISLVDPGKGSFRQTYVTAPPLPANFVPRPEALTSLRNALITDGGGNRSIALLAIQGMGGIGKTVLTQALCHDEVVQQAFPDGVIWVKAGKESAFSVVTQLREVGKALNDDLSRYDNELGSRNQYRSIMRSKAALIVVDDVWSASAIEPLRAESSRSRLLFTTRDASIAAAIGAQEYWAELLSEEQAREVFARWAGLSSRQSWPETEEIMRECQQLPLALSMVGAMLRGRPRDLWKRTLTLLRSADLEKIKVQFSDYPYPSLFAAIQVSVQDLQPEERQRYGALAVLLEEMPAARVVQQTLWNTDAGEAAETAEKLVSLSLAQREADGESIRLHDLQLDYVRAQYADPEALGLIHGALRLGAHVIARDARQFASQMVGRLLSQQQQAGIRRLVSNMSGAAPRPWLLSQWPSLDQPGGSLLLTLQGHSSLVNGVAVTPDGRRGLSASYDKTLRVWDLDSGKELLTLHGHSRYVTGVAVTPDGRRALSGSYDNTLKVWDLDSGKELLTLQGHSGYVNGVAVTPDGRRGLSASADNTLKVWDLDSGKELLTLQGHSSYVTGVAVTPDGRRALSASWDNTLKVWDLDSGKGLLTLHGHSSYVTGVAVTPDGRRALSASWDNMLKVWDLDSGKELLTLQGHSSYVTGVAVTPDGRRALSASADNTLKVWDLDSGKELLTLQGHSSYVTGVAVTPEGRRALSASADKTLRVWDLDSGKELLTFQRHSSSVTGVAVTPDGRRGLSASADNTLKVWDLDSGKELLTLQGHSGYVTGVAVTPDGRRGLSASADNTLKVWDLDSGKELLTLQGHSRYVTGVAVTPDGRRALSGSYDNTLKVWDLDSGKELLTLQGHSGYVTGVAVTPDGRRALSTSWDNTLKVWDLDSGKELLTLQGHSDWVRGVAVTPDGRRALSASADNTLKVWDLDSVQLLAGFTCDAGATCCACVSNARFVGGDAGGRVYLLELVV